jgi:hypothetical protein
MATPKFTKKEYIQYLNHVHKAQYSTPEAEFASHSSVTYKICSKCSANKTLSQYNGNTSGGDGFDKFGIRLRRPECSKCTKQAREGIAQAIKYAKDMGIPYKAPPGTVCVICNKPPKGKDKLVFDHCHETNTFRGYCCNPCNRSMGVLGDNAKGILRTLNYLLKTEKITLIQNYDFSLSIKHTLD